MRRHDALQGVPCAQIRPERDGAGFCSLRRSDGQNQRSARLPQPHLVGIHLVPGGDFIGLQQEMDECRGRAVSGQGGGAERLHKMAPLRMRRHVQETDHLPRAKITGDGLHGALGTNLGSRTNFESSSISPPKAAASWLINSARDRLNLKSFRWAEYPARLAAHA